LDIFVKLEIMWIRETSKRDCPPCKYASILTRIVIQEKMCYAFMYAYFIHESLCKYVSWHHPYSVDVSKTFQNFTFSYICLSRC
jgi:hypothetical protein